CLTCGAHAVPSPSIRGKAYEVSCFHADGAVGARPGWSTCRCLRPQGLLPGAGAPALRAHSALPSLGRKAENPATAMGLLTRAGPRQETGGRRARPCEKMTLRALRTCRGGRR